ncbi:MAG: DNA-binding protein WhiA [Candidatus Eremiobacteraeota bacterium]|nr:DNA-binding protein WhiA [Candidatus Eremiobacteraeota bacterium]
MSSSLSADTKDALARETPGPEHCKMALLHGLALYGSGKDGIVFSTQRNAVARLFWSLLRDRKANPIKKILGTRLYRTPSYRIDLPSNLQGFPPKPRLKCDRILDLRAAFLACGSLSAATHGYHLEFVLSDEVHAERLFWILKSLVHEPKSTVRKSRPILYYKDFEAIIELLSTIGAFGAMLHLEDVRALKETKNRIHRLVNTEAANVDRAAAAAAAQRQTITFIADVHGLRKLSPALREIAEIRLRHPEETLAELGVRCNPPASKSAVNSRLVALARLAARLRGDSKRARAPSPGNE